MGENVEESRTRKSVLNLVVTVITQVCNLLIKFIGRTIFIRFLGVEILGINGLFTNILTLLSLAELGFGNAVIYSMYKPLKENDIDKLSALTMFYKKIYRMIILAVFCIGIAFLPFLDKIVNMENSFDHLELYYLLFLMDTAFSYVYIYKQSIINANQKMYVLKIVSFLCQIIQFILQVIVLIFTKSFLLYLCSQIFCTLLNNIICSLIANKNYPYIKEKRELDSDSKKSILKNVKSLFLYKFTGTILNNTDNIYISLLIGTVVVGYYSNYYMVVNSINGIIYLVFSSVIASVGNLMTEDDKKKQNQIFLQLNFLCFMITGLFSIVLYAIFNDFIGLWVGKEFILDNMVVYITIANLYIYDMQIPVWIYRDTTGLFNDAKNATILVAVVNIVLSYFFGIQFGLFGILLATCISRLFITSWQQPIVLYKKILKSSSKMFFINKVKYLLFLIALLVPTFFIQSYYLVNNLFDLCVKSFLVVFLYFIFFFLCFHRTQEFIYFKNKFLNPFLGKIRRVKRVR